MTAFEETAKDILERMHRLEMRKAAENRELYQRRADVLAEVDELNAALARGTSALDAEQSTLELKLRELCLTAGEDIKTDHGEVKYRKGYSRVTYPTAEIDDLMDKLPPLKKALLPLRSESQVNPSASVNLFVKAETLVQAQAE